jgi:hypothetical protein
LIWGALSDERTGLPFTIAAAPQQPSHSGVRVPWDSRPYFTVSDSLHNTALMKQHEIRVKLKITFPTFACRTDVTSSLHTIERWCTFVCRYLLLHV